MGKREKRMGSGRLNDECWMWTRREEGPNAKIKMDTFMHVNTTSYSTRNLAKISAFDEQIFNKFMSTLL